MQLSYEDDVLKDLRDAIDIQVETCGLIWNNCIFAWGDEAARVQPAMCAELCACVVLLVSCLSQGELSNL